MVGKAISFNGSNSFVQVPDAPALQLTNELTIEFWVKRQQLTDDYIVNKGGDWTGGTLNYGVAIAGPANNNVFHFLYANGLRSTVSITDTNWHHCAVTARNGDADPVFYVDGVLQPVILRQGSATINLYPSTAPLLIGAQMAAIASYFSDALIDELSLYNRVLSQTEIQAIYTAGSAGKCSAVVSTVPVISKVSPAIGNIGTVVTISGNNFSPIAASNLVYFGAVQANVTSASPTNLMAAIPPGATYAPISVTVGGLAANSSQPFEPTFAGNGTTISNTNFSPSFNLTTSNGNDPLATVIADLDGDGKPDIALVNYYAHAVSIFRNISTNGTLLSAAAFAPRVDLALPVGTNGGNPYQLRAVDIDGDGKTDLLVSEANGSRVSIFHNVATPGSLTTNSFEAPISLPTGNDCRFAAAADLDGDGRLDIVTANYGDNTISIIKNIGVAGSLTPSSFAAPVTLDTAAGPYAIAIGDLDGDGKPDLAVANASANVISVFRNISTTGIIATNAFAARVDFPAQSDGDSILCGDMDGDGKPDLVVGFANPQIVSVYRNLSQPGIFNTNSLAPSVDFSTPGWAHSLALADFNGDGKPDIGVVGELSSFLSIFANVSTPGNFATNSLAARVDFGTGWNAWGLAAGDLDGDGRPDIVFCNFYDGNITIYQNQVPFETPPICTPAPAGLVGWWPGEGNANDIIGTNNAMLVGGASFASGKVGQGFRLDGINSYVQIPDAAELKPTNVTVEAWVWLDPNVTNVGGEYIIFKRNSWTYLFEGYALVKDHVDNGDGTYADRFGFIITRTGNQVILHSATLAQRGVWYHVAGTYDGNQATLWVNGMAEAAATPGFALDYGTRPVFLGTSGEPAPYTGMLAGIIDEPSIYNRALTTNEIQAIYNASSAGKCSTLMVPVITIPPTNQTVLVGGTASFTVTAIGTPPLSFQWSFNGTNINGATNSSLTLTNIQVSQTGSYLVLVTNNYGAATSSNAMLSVIDPQLPPTILTQTPSQIVLLGASTTFSVSVGGSQPLKYSWNRNGIIIPDATNATYTFSAQLSDSGSQFSCLITNAYGSASSTNVSLKVLNTMANDLCSGAISITNANYTNYQSTLKASSFGDPVPSCVDGLGHGVWYQFTAPVAGRLVVDTSGSDFDTGLAIYNGPCDSLTEVACNDDSGGVTSLINIPTAAGMTYLILAGGYGSDAGNLVLHLNYLTPPAFAIQPTNQSVVVSSNTSFTTTVIGTQPINLQWFFNNVPLVDGGRISGSTNATLNLASVQISDAGNYQLVASNIVGVSTSSVAILTPVILPPIIMQQPVDQIILLGSNVTFTAAVAGTPPYNFQWSFDGTPLTDDGIHIFGSATISLSLSNITTADVGFYSLTVTNVSGFDTSSNASLTLLTPPSITAQPVGRSVPPGLPTTFTATVSGNPTPSYQWQLNGTNIPGATSLSYSLPAVGSNDLGFYRLVASNSVSVVVSTDAQLTFGPVAAWGRNLDNECLPPPGLSNVIEVAGSWGASFAVRADGRIVTWGSGSFSAMTNIPDSATNVAMVSTFAPQGSSVGNYALRTDGTVVSWGGFSAPVLSNIVSVASGPYFGYAVRAEGTVASWSLGNIGPGPAFPAGLNHVAAVACGFNNAIALRNDGTVIAAAPTSAQYAVTNIPSGLSNVVAIAAGFSYAMALKADGSVIAWGSGTGTNLPPKMTNIVAISAGNYSGENFGLAIRANDSVVTWGDNLNGDTNQPAALTNLFCIAGAAAAFHGLALVNDGSPVILHPPVGLTAYTGRDVTLHGDAVGAQPLSYQWLLNGTNIPGATDTTLTISNVQFSSAGDYQLLVTNTLGTALSLTAPVNVIQNNSLVFLSQPTGFQTNYQGSKVTLGITVLGSGPLSYQWSYSLNNQIFTPISGATNDSLVLDPALASQSGYYHCTVSNSFNSATSSSTYLRVLFAKAFGYYAYDPTVNVTNTIAIATGSPTVRSYSDYFVLGADGKLTSWANYSSTYGEANVSALSNSFVIAITTGTQHSLALRADGSVYAWGYYGQSSPILNPPYSIITSPPTGLNNIIAIASGENHDLALQADGTVIGWGQNTYGQATNNSTATNVVAIAGGGQHSLALRANGTVVAWGYNSYGQTTVPPTATNIIAIAAGSQHSLALRANGTVLQWGSGNTTPIPTGLTNVVAISASGYHSTALRTDGSVISWGNESGLNASNSVPSDLANVIQITSGGDHDFALFGTRVPSFTVQPWSRTVPNTTTSVVFVAKCAAAQPVSYQWRLNGINLPGATNDTLTVTGSYVPSVTRSPYFQPIPAGNYDYQLIASNAYGITASKPAKLSVIYPVSDALDTTNANGSSIYNWITGGNAQWFGQTNITHDGVDAARSGAIGALQETILQTTVATNWAGRYTFWWKVSSEPFFDILEFRINGITITNISGEVNWQQVSIPVAAGTNVLQWRYSKDASYDAGQDAAWVDQFAYLPNAPVITIQPVSQIVNQGSNVTFQVFATGYQPFAIQWKQNTTNGVGIGASLTLNNASRAQNGSYSAVVSNVGGSTTSSNATLKVLVPQVLSTPQLLPDGTLQLSSSDAGGGAITPADLSNFEVQVSADLVNWVPLPNGLSLTNGTLQLQDNSHTNNLARFYRIIEH